MVTDLSGFTESDAQTGVPATVSLWLKPAQPQATQLNIYLQKFLDSSSRGAVRLTGQNVEVKGGSGNNDWRVLFTAPAFADRFHHLAVVYTETGAVGYWDGRRRGYQEAVFLDLQDSPLVVGGSNVGPGNPFEGAVDEFHVFSRAFSDNDVLQLYNWENTGKYIPKTGACGGGKPLHESIVAKVVEANIPPFNGIEAGVSLLRLAIAALLAVLGFGIGG